MLDSKKPSTEVEGLTFIKYMERGVRQQIGFNGACGSIACNRAKNLQGALKRMPDTFQVAIHMDSALLYSTQLN
ncbi:hypothetical protein CM49_02381 [Paenibacillus sp. P1XP2]|nr:hypothetical protein CM49_02381 [Paenibacillus sp. P1XP2]